MLVDDLEGTVQRAYGGLSASVYLLDGDGRVAFYGPWGQGPALWLAIEGLLGRNGTGTPAGRAVDRVPHLSAAIVAGQGEYFEVWNPDEWDQQMDQLQEIETNNQRFATLDLSRGFA